MIDPAGIPRIPGDMDALARYARELSGLGPDFAATSERVDSTWQQLAGVYEAPEVGALLAATGPVRSLAASVGEDIAAVGQALARYATTVREIQRQLDGLRMAAADLVAEARADKASESLLEQVGDMVGIGGDDEYAARGNALTGQVNAAVAAFFEAQRVCANAINALYGGVQYRADDGDGNAEPGEFGPTAARLDAAFARGRALPWGRVAETDTGLVGGLWEGLKTFVGDLGALIGRDPLSGDWSWDTAGTAWQGLGTFLYAVGTYVMPGGMVLDQTVGVVGFRRGELGQVLVGAGKGLIAYDEWGQGDNGRALGIASFNVLSAILGTKGAGAALRGLGAGAEASRLGVLAQAGTAMVRSGEFLTRLPTTDALLARITQHLPDLRIPPHLPDTHIPHHTDTPHAEQPRTHTPEPGTIGERLAHTDAPSTLGHHADAPSGAHENVGHEGPPQDGTHSGGDHVGDAAAQHRVATEHMPPPAPGSHSLEMLADSRVERGPDGLIDTVDGRPAHEYLHDVAEQRAQQYRGGRVNQEFSRRDIGEVSSVALDRHTGDLFESTNGRSRDGIPLDDLHPLLRARLERLEAGGPYGPGDVSGSAGAGPWPYPHPDNPLSHAEVRAVNELLWRRGASVGPDVFRALRVDNHFPFTAGGVRSAPCCANCSALLAETPSNAGRFTGYPPGPKNLLPE